MTGTVSSRRALGRALFAATCLASLLACGPRYQNVAQRPLPATDALSCSGYLVWNQEPVRDVFLVINGSGTLSNAFVHPTFEDLVGSEPVAYATYDKPGIRAPFGDPAAVERNADLFEQYTLGHGVACATEGLRWAREQFGAEARLHVRGHSEGTLVALYAYDALFDSDRDLADMIDTFMLSGVALEPFADILQRQLEALPDGEKLQEALASCDRDVLMEGLGVSCAYVEDATARPSGRTMFERLAQRAPAAQFHVFQGTSDWHTPVEPVRELEAWNSSQGHLRMTFHYYDGGHSGGEAARAEMTKLLTTIVTQR